MKILKEILNELREIRKELHGIRNAMESTKEIPTEDAEEIISHLQEGLIKALEEVGQMDEVKEGNGNITEKE